MDKEQPPVVPNMTASADDSALRQQQARRQAAQRAARTTNPQRAVVAPAAKSNQTLGVVALVIGLVAVAGAGFLFTQLQETQQSLMSAQAIIRDQAVNIDSLNEKLSVTGENADLSVDALKSLLREHDQEIRKLWDVANKRNKSAIEDNTKGVAIARSGVDSLKKAQSQMQTTVDAANKSIADTNTAISAVRQRLDRVEIAASSLPAEAELAIAQNKEAVQTVETTLAGLSATVEKMRKAGTSGDIGGMKLEIEDIQIRLDRIQNALGGTAP